MINGDTIVIAHLVYPTTTFKAPMIYNLYFEKMEINAVIVPMGIKPEGHRGLISALSRRSGGL